MERASHMGPYVLAQNLCRLLVIDLPVWVDE